MLLENKWTHNYQVHYSRYIASWKRAGGVICRDPDTLFVRWLREEAELTDEEISDILLLVESGKLELETNAMLFMAKHKDEFEKEKEEAANCKYHGVWY